MDLKHSGRSVTRRSKERVQILRFGNQKVILTINQFFSAHVVISLGIEVKAWLFVCE